MTTLRTAVIVGSLRRESINKKLAEAIVGLSPPTFDFFSITLADLPMYNQDLEPDRPESVRRFTSECASSDAILFVMPEFNRSIPAVLKNAIDWGSKPMDRNVWRDKPVAITGASPGAIGTAVGQQHLRQVMGILGSSVMGGEAYISFKPDLIGTDGRIQDQNVEAFLNAYMKRFAVFAMKLTAA